MNTEPKEIDTAVEAASRLRFDVSNASKRVRDAATRFQRCLTSKGPTSEVDIRATEP